MAPPSLGVHRTGDAGHFDAAGNLVVSGRLDEVIVTSTGRNIHPEWIEALILGDPRITRCAVVGAGAHIRAVLCPADDRLAEAGQASIDAMVATLCADAPDYARPRDNILVSERRLSDLGLIGPDGRLRRRDIAARIKEIA